MSEQTTPIQPTTLRASDTAILWRCFTYLRPYWRTTAGTYVAMVIITAAALITPQFIRWIVDHGIREQNRTLLAWSVIALLGITLIRGVVTFLQGRWSEVSSQGVAYDLRNALYQKLTDLSFAYHDRTETGQLLSRAIQDVDRVRFLTGRAVLRLVESIVLALGTLIVLFAMNPTLAILSMAMLPLLAHRAYAFGRKLRPFSLAVQQQLAVLTTRLEQNLRGARAVKAFAQEEAEIDRFTAENNRWFDLSAEAARLQAINNPLLDLIANIGTVLVIWYGGLQVINGTLTLGELVAFNTYLAQLLQPVRRLGLIIPAISMAATAGERIFEILDTPSAVADAPDAYPLPPVKGQVSFEGVGFAYFGQHQVLKGINLEVQPGQIIALLGSTGSGKSSLINLIPRFYDPTEGRVTVDGHDLRRVTLSSLRDQIGIVLQESTLFAATIRENIAFGRPDATEAEIIAAAQAAQAHDFITRMPDGYATEVGERGVTLSGGQKQRVAIARALLKDPRILLLDDATASVDTATERQIQMALERLMRGRTSFVIAQRLSTVRLADRIVVMEKGRIVATGTHRELLQRSELYARIYHDQLRPQEQTEPIATPA
jgi:ATP-binding cassette, subfamily B, multidrug efflux pump